MSTFHHCFGTLYPGNIHPISTFCHHDSRPDHTAMFVWKAARTYVPLFPPFKANRVDQIFLVTVPDCATVFDTQNPTIPWMPCESHIRHISSRSTINWCIILPKVLFDFLQQPILSSHSLSYTLSTSVCQQYWWTWFMLVRSRVIACTFCKFFYGIVALSLFYVVMDKSFKNLKNVWLWYVSRTNPLRESS
jgi:hypothetical protein